MAIPTAVLIAAFGAMMCWAIGDFLIQRTTRKIGNIETLAFIGIVGSIALFPLILKDFELLFSYQNLILLGVLGLVTFVAAWFDFEALRTSKLSTTDVIIELELPITISLGYLIFNELLSLKQMLIVGMIFVGIILTATQSISHLKIKWERGVMLALLAAIGMGLINFLTSASSRTISPMMAIWAPWVVFTVFCLVIIYKKNGMSHFYQNAKQYKWLVLWMGLFDTAAWLFYAFAVVDSNIGVITAITESYPAAAIFLGVWINKEKINWHQYVGAFIAITCSILLATAV